MTFKYKSLINFLPLYFTTEDAKKKHTENTKKKFTRTTKEKQHNIKQFSIKYTISQR